MVGSGLLLCSGHLATCSKSLNNSTCPSLKWKMGPCHSMLNGIKTGFVIVPQNLLETCIWTPFPKLMLNNRFFFMSSYFLFACILVHLSNSLHKLLNIICAQSTSNPTSWSLVPFDLQHTYFDKLIMNQVLSICQWHTLYLSSQNKSQTPSQKYSRIILDCYGLVPSNQCPTMWLNLPY